MKCIICSKVARYGNDYFASHCKNHKEIGMTMKPNKCIKCDEIATHGKEVTKWCCEHAPPRVRFIITCIICQVKKAKYCFGSSDVPTHCLEHKENSMQIFHASEPKYCCENIAEYGFFFAKKTHCEIHRLPNQYKNNNPKCRQKSFLNYFCPEIPCWSDCDYPLRCYEHRKPGDVNICEQKCESCGLNYLLINSKLCDFCRQKTKPCRKEIYVKNYLKRENIKFVHNKSVQENTKCSKRRPDFIIDRGEYKIIVEVDEFQHKNYMQECEITRMKQIYFDYGGFNICFIRYNPDNKLFKHKKQELISLIREINFCDEQIMVHYLFYNHEKNSTVIIDPYA
jgi:hypothetical protein